MSKKINYCVCAVNSHSGMKMLIEIENKKHDLLEDKVSDWLQIWKRHSA